VPSMNSRYTHLADLRIETQNAKVTLVVNYVNCTNPFVMCCVLWPKKIQGSRERQRLQDIGRGHALRGRRSSLGLRLAPTRANT
jgi:hypothetical protein